LGKRWTSRYLSILEHQTDKKRTPLHIIVKTSKKERTLSKESLQLKDRSARSHIKTNASE
jgi:hypothetical protein